MSPSSRVKKEDRNSFSSRKHRDFISLQTKVHTIKVEKNRSGMLRVPKNKWGHRGKKLLMALRMKYSNEWKDLTRIYNMAFNGCADAQQARSTYSTFICRNKEEAEKMFRDLQEDESTWALITETVEKSKTCRLSKKEVQPQTFQQLCTPTKARASPRTPGGLLSQYDSDSDGSALPARSYELRRKGANVIKHDSQARSPSTDPEPEDEEYPPIRKISDIEAENPPKLLFRCYDQYSQGSVNKISGIQSQRMVYGGRFPGETDVEEFLDTVAAHLNRKPFYHGSPFISLHTSFLWTIIMVHKLASERGTRPKVVVINPNRADMSLYHSRELVGRTITRGERKWRKTYVGACEYVAFGHVPSACILGVLDFEDISQRLSRLFRLDTIWTGRSLRSVKKDLDCVDMDNGIGRRLLDVATVVRASNWAQPTEEELLSLLMKIVGEWTYYPAGSRDAAKRFVQGLLVGYQYPTRFMPAFSSRL